MLSFEGLSQAHQLRPIFKHTSFCFEYGSINLILGENGVGKTTLLKIISGVLDFQAVSIKNKGKFIAQRDLRRLCFFQADRTPFYPELSLSENLSFFAGLYGVSIKNSKIERIIVELKLQRLLHLPMLSLSFGTKEKLGFLYTILANRPVKCFDEPFSGLDDASVAVAIKYFDRWKAEGDLVVMSTHHIPAGFTSFDQKFQVLNQQLVTLY